MKSKNKFHGININSIDINDISSLLIKSGYMDKFRITEDQSDILNGSNIYYTNLYENFEVNEAITSQEITQKYKNVISSINTKFNIKISFTELYKQYIFYTKAHISLNIFINWLIILDLLMSNFQSIINDPLNNWIENRIILFNINTVYDNFDNNSQNIDKLDKIYENIIKHPLFLEKNVESDLIIVIYLISLENRVIFDKDITSPRNVINILEIYNKIYYSNINISILIYIEMILIINMCINFHRSKKISIEQALNDNKPNISSKSYNKRKISTNNINEFKNINPIKNEIPNFNLFDDELNVKSNLDINENALNVFLFQNSLKLYSLYHLSKSKIKIKINISIQNIQELIFKLNNYNNEEEKRKRKQIEKNKISNEMKGPFAPNNNFEENLKNYISINKLKSSRNQLYKMDKVKNGKEINTQKNKANNKSFFNTLSTVQNLNLNLNKIKIMTQNNIYTSLNNFIIDELLLKFINTMSIQNIKKINTNYSSIISNSNSCYFQESIISFISNDLNKNLETNNNINEMMDSSISLTPRSVLSKTQIIKIKNRLNAIEENIVDNLSINDFFNEIEILNYFMDYYSRSDIKKLPKIMQIKFHTFKCNINQNNKTIQIFFNFSKIKEKVLFEFLKQVKNMYTFIQKYISIIKCLKEFKLYQSTIRVSQTNFRSNQLNYLFNILTHKLVDIIEDNSFNKIMIYETQLNNYNPNMRVYIRDYSVKKKNLGVFLKLVLFKCNFFNKFKYIIEYLYELAEQWELIVLSDSEKDIRLIKCFDDNKLFIFLLKEKESNNNKNMISIINNKNNNVNDKDNNDNKNKKKKAFNKPKKESDNKNNVYEYLNIIMYIKNSRQDFINIMKTMEAFLGNKNLGIDFKTNLICDRIFFEDNIMNDNRMQNMQVILLNMIDDFFLVTKTFDSLNKEYLNNQKKTNFSKITKSILNEYYNYDFFIGDDYIGVLNNHLYDANIDINNNFINLIHDFLSVLSSCLELIYFILKIKSIFILRFIYIIHTKDNCYYCLEIKNWNFFIKKMRDFSSLFTANIKLSKPLFCLLKTKTKLNSDKNIDDAMEDNFFDIFLRLFLNLNKVFKNQELNKEFLKKLHKNIFKDYSYELVAFSYEAFLIFNNFFMSNNYMSISKGEKFENCYIIPSEGFFDKKNYKNILNFFDSGEESNLISKNIFIFNFGIDSNYLFKNKQNVLFGFSKINYFVKEYNNYILNRVSTENKNKKDLLKKKFEAKKVDKKNINKYIKLIEQFQLGNLKNDNNIDNAYKLIVFNSPIEIYNSIIKDYNQQKILVQTQKNELNVFQNEEKNINDNKSNDNELGEVNNKKDCIIF